MNMKVYVFIFCLCFATAALAQRPPSPEGAPGAGGSPPQPGQLGPDGMPDQPHHPGGDWIRALDANHDGKFDLTELAAAMDFTFAKLDKNGNGVLEPPELRRPPRPGDNPQSPGGGQMPRPMNPPEAGQDRPGPGMMLPPFFFLDRVEPGASITRADFDRIVRAVFSEMDRNGDGAISREESRPPRRPGDPQGPPPEAGPPAPPNARFIGAELRFGDIFVRDQPFSAETVISGLSTVDRNVVVEQKYRRADIGAVWFEPGQAGAFGDRALGRNGELRIENGEFFKSK
jgi:EF hand